MAFSHWDDDERGIWDDAGLEEIDDPWPASLFEAGFIDKEISADERHLAREMFFDWYEEMGYAEQDFPWDEWREWYENAA